MPQAQSALIDLGANHNGKRWPAKVLSAIDFPQQIVSVNSTEQVGVLSRSNSDDSYFIGWHYW